MFGNCIAKLTLLAAHDLARAADAAPNSTFKRIADLMFIPYDADLDYHPEFLHWNESAVGHGISVSLLVSVTCAPRVSRCSAL